MTKRLFSAIAAITLIICAVPLFNTNASASPAGYNVKSSLIYAQKNWNNGVGLCAEYASRCLNAGGVDVFETQVKNLYNALASHGKAYKLTLTEGTRGKINMADNAGKLKAGDPIFYQCNYCGNFEHVVICNGANKYGYAQDYAHNNAHNGYKTTYTYRHCGGDSWTLYSINMFEREKLFGAKSDIVAPAISSVKNGRNGIVIKWNKISNADKYRVYRKLDNGSWKKIAETKTAYYTDKKASNGDFYTYTIRAVSEKSVSQYYAGETAKCIGMPKLKSPAVSQDYIRINWQCIADADGYYVYRKTPGENWKRIANVKSGSRAYYTDRKAEADTQYLYTVRAYNDSVSGCYNNSGVAASKLTTPELSAVCEPTGITVNFNKIPGADGYRIYRKNDAGNWKRIYDVTDVNTTCYTDTDVEEGKSYCYTVRAMYGKALSLYNRQGVNCLYAVPNNTEPDTTDPSDPIVTVPSIPDTSAPILPTETVASSPTEIAAQTKAN